MSSIPRRSKQRISNAKSSTRWVRCKWNHLATATCKAIQNPLTGPTTFLQMSTWRRSPIKTSSGTSLTTTSKWINKAPTTTATKKSQPQSDPDSPIFAQTTTQPTNVPTTAISPQISTMLAEEPKEVPNGRVNKIVRARCLTTSFNPSLPTTQIVPRYNLQNKHEKCWHLPTPLTLMGTLS